MLAKKAVFRFFYRGVTLPMIMLSWFTEYLGLWGIREDIEKCGKVIKEADQSISRNFVDALVAAEDRRNPYHRGVDPIAIMRVVFVWIARRDVQGASTIEQQFVRVVSGRYERTIQRKVREQLLALSIARRFSKVAVARSYLAIACYGTGLVGIEGMRSICRDSIENAGVEDAIQVVVRLKYPEPVGDQIAWRKLHSARVSYVSQQLEQQVTSAGSSLAVLTGSC